MNKNEFKNSLKYINKKYKNKDQLELYNKMNFLVSEYERNNSIQNREFLCYLTAAIFLIYKKIFTQLSLYLSFRTKGDSSFIHNVEKEFTGYILETPFNTEWDLFDILKDVSGIRIVLNDINYSVPPSAEMTALFKDKDVKRALGNANSNSSLLNEVTKYLNSQIKTEKKYMELKNKILKRLKKITPEEFTEERKPFPSYAQLSEEFDNIYESYTTNPDNFNINASTSDIDELKEFADALSSRQFDELHTVILDKTLPIVLNDPLITNALQTYSKFEKHRYKPNAFTARYDNLKTPFGDIELQSQSNKAYYTAIKGSAAHSEADGKNIDVRNYFELVDPNDKYPLSYYLDILDSVSADSLVSPYELPKFKNKKEKEEFMKTQKGQAFLESEQYRNLMKHIKLKDTMEVLPAYIPKKVYYKKDNKITNKIDPTKLQECIESGEIKLITVNTDEYLFLTALSLSPYMNICSAGHTSFTTASIHHKKIIGEFAEILRKKDCNTCLRDLLIRRVEYLIESNRKYFNDLDNSNLSNVMKSCLKVVKEHEEMANALPKDISIKNILIYSENLNNIVNDRENHEDYDLEM